MFGTIVNVLSWVSAWARIGPLAYYSFFPLWLGFILVVDAVTEARSGTSLWRRGAVPFIALFLVSAPFWWYFERLNARVSNWHYRTHRHFSAAEYIFWASLAFSTVIPAVLSMAELLRTFGPHHATDAKPARLPNRVAATLIVLGVVTLALSLAFPRQCFPFLWLSLLLILDPVNSLAGAPSVIAFVRARAYRPILTLMAAGLICGFFWEMWNAWSLPRWWYSVPYVGFGKLFEMPVLGYGGYPPFALEIFAAYQFARLITRQLRPFPRDYVRI